MATPNPQISLEARQTVLDQIVAGASFTAYEITLEVRRRLGPTVEVPHGVVNTVVQTMFANGEMAGYDRAPDTTVRAATPPFRYAPKTATGGRGRGASAPPPAAVAAPAAVLGVNRANLPINLSYSNPVAAVVREYALEARAFHDAAGIGDTPFDVWLPTSQDPRFRVRSYGAGLSEAEVEARYSLLYTSQSDFGSKAAFAYAEEFRVTSFSGGIAKTFRVALDFNLIGTVTKDGEVPTRQPDGMEVEVPVKAANIPLNVFGHEAARAFAYFRVAPRIQGGQLFVFKRAEVLFEGKDWKITRGGNSFAIMGDVAYPINTTLPLAGSFARLSAPVGVELSFAPGELEVSENGESLVYSDKTRIALGAAFRQVERESPQLIEQSLASAPNLWETKIRFSELSGVLKDYLQRVQQKVKSAFQWNGIGIDNSVFNVVVPNETVIIAVSRVFNGAQLRTKKTTVIVAQNDTVIFFNDLGTKTGSPTRIREYFAAHPQIKRVYVLTFASDAAKERFIAANNFQTVPVQLLSSLPKPASTKSSSPYKSNRAPFDPAKHGVQAPQNPLLTAIETLDDAGFANLEKWAREVPLDGKNWPDFKRLYKRIETHVWPFQNRFRWSRSESDVPQGAPLASEREALLLGVLMGRLDSEEAKRENHSRLPDGGPSVKTVAYMTRRAARLLAFLRDERTLTSQRRALLAPLVAGSMERIKCSDIRSTLAFRLGLHDKALEPRPDLVRRVWNDVTLAAPVLKWAFDWLRGRGETVEGSVLHVRRFVLGGDLDVVVAILPPLLQNRALWQEYRIAELARDLQAGFETRRGEVLRLFAHFPMLVARDRWILDALDTPEADEPEVVAFATPLVEARAKAGQLELVNRLSPKIRAVFLEALVAAKPQGLTLKEWERMEGNNLMGSLFPALVRMPMALEIAVHLWTHSHSSGTEFLGLGGEAHWTNAFRSVIQANAQREDFGFALELPPLGRTLFFQMLGSAMNGSTWRKMSELDDNALSVFTPDIARLPLSSEFWTFVGELEAQQAGKWLQMVGRERATTEFVTLPSSEVYSLLHSNARGLEALIGAWLGANAAQVADDDPLLLLASINLDENVRTPALALFRQRPLNLRSALRLFESGLPEAQTLARPYFENEGEEWAGRALALADSPVAATRQYGLDLLARFRERWTPDLLKSLAQHDDTRVQAFVAAQLQQAPEVGHSEAVRAFDDAIINSRGRSRRAKVGVQRRLATVEEEETPQLEALLDAARNGAPRDRAWALQQLVRLQLSGADVPDLQLSGAVARASS